MDELWKLNEWVTELAEPFWLKDAQKDGEFFDANGFARALLSARKPAAAHEKIAPVQGYTPGIPWSLHLEAYDAYSKRWSPQPAMIDLEGRNCRGGFSTGELDVFIPGWRDRVSEIGKLKARVAELESALAARSGDDAAQAGARGVLLTGAQLVEALDLIAPDRATDPDQLEGEVKIQRGDGHSGRGIYCWLSEYPDEGATLLTGAAPDSSAGEMEVGS